jgi:hypothetical protein
MKIGTNSLKNTQFSLSRLLLNNFKQNSIMKTFSRFSLPILQVVAIFLLSTAVVPASAQRLLSKMSTRLSSMSYASPNIQSCQCPEGATIINRQTVYETGIEANGIQGETYCLKNMTLVLDELTINNGRLVIMPESRLIVRGPLHLNAGQIDLQTGATLKAEVFHNLSGSIHLDKETALYALFFNDFNGEITLAENSKIEVERLLRLNETKKMDYTGSAKGAAVLSVYGEMAGNGIENFLGIDDNIRWDIMPNLKMALK